MITIISWKFADNKMTQQRGMIDYAVNKHAILKKILSEFCWVSYDDKSSLVSNCLFNE